MQLDHPCSGRRRRKLTHQEDKLKSLVAIAAEVKQPKGFGRIRLRRVADKSADSLLPFVRESVEPGSVIRTDGSWAFTARLPITATAETRR